MNAHLSAHVAHLLRLAQQHRAAHWMVSGPQFLGLHAHFEELYHRLDGWADELAERVCRLGGRPPLELEEIVAAAPAGGGLDAARPLAGLIATWSALGESTQRLAAAVDQAGDRVSAAILEGQLAAIEKELWILGRLAA